MGFISKIINLFKKPAETVVVQKDSQWGKLWKTVNESQILDSSQGVALPYEQVPSVYKAVKAICDNVPQAELGFFDWQKDERDYDSASAKALIALFDKPNPLMSGRDFIQYCAGYYSLYGECFVIKQNKNRGEMTVGQLTGTQLPDELWTFDPTQFQAVIEEGRLVAWNYGNKMRFSLNEVIVVKDFNPRDVVRGLAPTKAIRKLIDIDYQTLVYNKSFFDHDATCGFVLKTDKNMTEEQREQLQIWWNNRYKGASNAYKLAVMEGGLTPERLSVTPKEMDFIEQKKFTREEITGTWRVPKCLLNITDDINYATYVGQVKSFWQYGIMPILLKFEDAFNTRIVVPFDSRLYCKFDLSQVPAFQEDLGAKVDTATKLFNIGIPLNAINARLGLGFDEFEWGDSPYNQDAYGSYEEEQTEDKEEEGEKAVKHCAVDSGKRMTKAEKIVAWQKFIRTHEAIEHRMRGAVKKFFYEQRVRVLSTIDALSGTDKAIKAQATIGINWGGEKEMLKAKITPYLASAIKEGVKQGQKRVPFMVNREILEQRIQSLIVQRRMSIERVQDTVEKLVDSAMANYVTGQSITKLADEIKQIYNKAGNRALTIARTETGVALNSGSFMYYEQVQKESGYVMYKEWITANDEMVRESHQEVENEVVLLKEDFSNGLAYPNDPKGEPEDIINCRCTYATIVE